jgi:two-component system, LytTR family, response regulator
MKKLRAILIDDENSGLSALYEKLQRHCPQVEVLQLCETPEDGINAINTLKPDLVFLDVEMPLMNGFVLLQQLQYKNFELIFVTAYDQYAIKAIRYSALDYLLKPVEVDELKAAVDKALEKKQIAQKGNPRLDLLLENLELEKKKFKRIAIPERDGMQFVKIEDIIYLEASANYTQIHLPGGTKLMASRNLKEFEELLPTETFIRIHHSFIININCVEKYIRGDGGQVVLSNKAVLDVAKRKKHEFLKAVGY